ncbi:MAG: HAD hydrolase-like protein [Anaerolineales bacterium]|nr:HAD hydrolase-like protein [Anaerolineales bacterium]
MWTFPPWQSSARDESWHHGIRRQYDLVKYFDVIVSGLIRGTCQTLSDPILLAAQKMNVSPQNCLMIGDTTVDIRARWSICGRTDGSESYADLAKAELKKMGADMILKDTTKLLDILN